MLDLTRRQLLGHGVILGFGVLDRSGIQRPSVVVHDPRHRLPDAGWYRGGTVHVNLPRNQLPTRTPGYAWSFPGYKADRTPVGVFTHECGHHVDACRGTDTESWTREAAVSGYEPNAAERFAEAFRLFCTNPDLLRQGRPRRWEYLTETMRLDPGEVLPWREVLEGWGAHERFLQAAKNWIKR